MNLNQPTLVQFETEFRNERKNNRNIPPLGSNSFYNIGDGEINLLTKRDDPEDCRFDLFTNRGTIYTGAGVFNVSGDIKDSDHPYENLIVITNTNLNVNYNLTISKGNLEVHGGLELMNYSQLVIRDGANVTFYADSTFTVRNDTQIVIEGGSSLTVYGRIDVHLSRVNNLLNTPGVIIDSAAVMNVDGMEELGQRHYSLTDYYTELSKRIINKYTQSEKNFSIGRIGYTWTDGNPLNQSQIIQMSVLWGEAVLGDFKLSALGFPETEIPNLQMISDVLVKKDTTLYISEEYRGSRYIHPELYLGVVIGNNRIPGNCVVEGTIIVDGVNSLITLDRGATMYITETGEVYLKNGSIMKSTYNEDLEVLVIDGTLIIETIEQINTFNKENIVFGEKGKIIILNPDTGEKKLLWTTPNGIEDTDLYRLFKDRIDHIEYHISNNNGIGIDEYYEFYARDMVNWYGGRRIEKAVHDGILVWHDGGFIQLDHDIIPWADIDCSLLQASRLFKTFGSYDPDKLQEAVERMKYAGFGNITFIFVNGDESKEVTLVLEDIHMKNILNHPLTDMYTLTTDNDGELFLRNKVGKATAKNVINEKARSLSIEDKKVKFKLP